MADGLRGPRPGCSSCPVINDPDSVLAVVTSLIPWSLPRFLMMLRIAVKMPPSLADRSSVTSLTAGLCVLMDDLALRAGLPGTGILMYGKKPSLQRDLALDALRLTPLVTAGRPTGMGSLLLVLRAWGREAGRNSAPHPSSMPK